VSAQQGAPPPPARRPCRFSIVVAVHDVEGFLPDCLDSVLGQSFADLEVIAVDDAATDRSGAVLDARAATDARLRVIHLPDNVGLGEARNVGLDAARGRYLLFVDGDDTLPSGALAALADRIATTGQPDIVLFDFARTDSTGVPARDGRLTAIAADGPDVFSADERPEVFRLLLVVWTKAYRLDWVRAHGFRFSAGYYEDVAWTYPVLMTAERITALDRVGYHYRQARHGSILATRTRRHFDAFTQYDRVFGYLDVHPELERWRSLMFARMLRHFVTILTMPDRLPSELHREFFDAATRAYWRHLPGDYRAPRTRGAIWSSAFARGDYRIFRAAQLARRLADRGSRQVSTARRGGKRAGRLGRRALGRLYYQLRLRRPVDEQLVVYAAYWARGYSCNPAAIYEAARELAPQLRGVWVVRADHVDRMPSGVDYVVQESAAYYRVMAQAKFFVNNVNFPHEIVKRAGTVHLQTHHGTPIKTMGLAMREHPVVADGMDFARLMAHADRWDYVLSANRYSTEVWRRAFPNRYTTLEFGLPRNDRLVRATADDVAAARRALDLPPGKPALLYLPTFRDWLPRGAEPPLELAEFCAQVGERFTVLMRSHYFEPPSERIAELAVRGVLRDVSAYSALPELLLAADVLVTDYSSVMFDYALLDRPIVVLADDWETYVRVRGVTYDLLAGPPGIVATSAAALIEALLSGRYDGADATRLRADFRQRFCEFDDGHAAENVVRRVLLGDSTGDRISRVPGG